MQLWAEGVEYQERQAWSTQPCPGSCCDTWQTPGILRQVDTVVCIAQAQLLVQTLVQSLPATAPTARHTLRMGRGEERGRGGWRAHRSRSGGWSWPSCVPLPPARSAHPSGRRSCWKLRTEPLQERSGAWGSDPALTPAAGHGWGHPQPHGCCRQVCVGAEEGSWTGWCHHNLGHHIPQVLGSKS
ncbi:uncharacterized protein LOC119709128 isoform X4 [Motacilla alba alba]|uniref:uncharacterized protein LOC119709128 isoform X4 n=1 Tax=Motacilla alba alba TaxID=1094192 RepID=UPI0018D55A05|nr:uncharacterized protein LOC119709128 isoform X4 [Motacilla alba alba]